MCVSAFRSRRTQIPVGRFGEPARSMPTTTNSAFFAIVCFLFGEGIVACLRVSELASNGLSGFVQMLLQVGHKRRTTGADGRGIGGAGLVLAVDVAVGIADMDFPKLGQ